MRLAIQRSLALGIALALAFVLQTHDAEAKCASPSGHWSLQDGQAIPAKATLFYFVPSWRADKGEPSVFVADKPILADWKEVSTSNAFTTYRLSFDAGGADEIIIMMKGSTQRHPVRRWKAPNEKRVKGRLFRREQSRWTCSHTDIVPGELKSEAQAFRVDWIDVRNGVIDFGHGSMIFPRSSTGFWRYGKKKRSATARFEFGHPNCFGTNIPVENLNSMQISVTPLFRDGSEGKSVLLTRAKAISMPEEVEEVEPKSEAELNELPIDELPAEKVRQIDAKTKSTSAPLPTRLFAIALLLGVLFGFQVFRAHRRAVPARRLIAAGSMVSLAGGSMAWAASAVSFPYWLLFLGAGLLLLALAAHFLEHEKS